MNLFKSAIAVSVVWTIAGLAANAATALHGYIDKSGKVVIPPKYEEASEFSESRAQVKKDGKALYIDTTGNVVLDPHSSIGGNFSNGLANVMKNENQWIYVDKDGKQVLPKTY